MGKWASPTSIKSSLQALIHFPLDHDHDKAKLMLISNCNVIWIYLKLKNHGQILQPRCIVRSDLFGVPRFGGLRVTDLHFLAESDAEKLVFTSWKTCFIQEIPASVGGFFMVFHTCWVPCHFGRWINSFQSNGWPKNDRAHVPEPLHGSIYTKPILVWLFSY